MKGIVRICLLLTGFLLLACDATADGVQQRLSITSQPSGASVTVDGRDCGTTPLTLFDLAPGRHHLKFRLAGFAERDRFVDLPEGQIVERNEVLHEETGLLLVKTDPTGCQMTIDGVSFGQTPCLVTTLSSRESHTVRLRKAGYRDQSFTVKFNGRTPLVREERLVLDSGIITVLSDPPGAEITVNGISRGQAPVDVAGIPKGRAVVKFALNGFQPETRELAMNAGERQTLSVALEALPGTMHLTSVPDGARFYVNGESHGKGPLVLSGLKPGTYQVRVELDGYAVASKDIALENGASAREEFRLSNVMGRIEVRSSPPGAQVLLDGKPVGLTSAQSDTAEYSDALPLERVLAGEHTLVIRKEGYAERTRHPKVENEKTAQVNVRLERIFTPNVELVTSRGTYRGVLVSRTVEGFVVEVSLGITQSFPREEIRSFRFLESAK